MNGTIIKGMRRAFTAVACVVTAAGSVLGSPPLPAAPAMAGLPGPVGVPAISHPQLALQIGHASSILCLAISPDGNTVATGGLDGVVLWDIHTGQIKAHPQMPAGLSKPEGMTTTVAFSLDGRTLVTTEFLDDIVYLWDARTGELEEEMAPLISAVMAVGFPPDGKLIQTGTTNVTHLWDGYTRQLIRTLLVEQSTKVRHLAFSPDGRLLATSETDNQVRLRETSSWQLKATFPGNPPYLAFSPDGSILATLHNLPGVNKEDDRSNEVQLWDTGTSQLKGTVPDVGNGKVLFSPDGRTLATLGTKENNPTSVWKEWLTIFLWNVSNPSRPSLKAVLRGHTKDIADWLFSPDGRLLATCGMDGIARLWDARTGKVKAVLAGHENGVTRLAFTPDSKLLVTAATAMGDSSETTPRVWDTRTGRLRLKLQGAKSRIQSVALSSDGALMAGGDRVIRLWDMKNGRLQAVLPIGDKDCYHLAFSPDNQILAASCWAEATTAHRSVPGEVRLWNMESGKQTATIAARAYLGLVFSPDGKALATLPGRAPLDADVPISLWDIASGRLRVALPSTEGMTMVAFSPNSRTVAASGSNGREEHSLSGRSVRLFDVATGRLRATVESQESTFVCLKFSPDGRTLASGGSDGTVRLWDARTGQAKATLQGHKDIVRVLAFSPNGELLASGDGDKTVLWDVEKKKLKAVVLWPSDHFHGQYLGFGITFSKNGRWLAIAENWWGKANFWDVAAGRAVPVPSPDQLAGFPPEITMPLTAFGSSVLLHGPNGQVLATFVPVPEVAAQTAAARPIELGAKAIGALPAGDWFVTTPQGYFDCSPNAARFIRWNVGGVLYPAERYLRRFRRPDLVQKALHGKKIAAPAMTQDDIPPLAHFVALRDTGRANGVTVTVEVRGHHPPREVQLRVNDRPLPPAQARPLRVQTISTALAAQALGLNGRPIEVGAKPIDIGAKPIDIGAKPIDIGAKPAGRVVGAADENRRYPFVRRFTFQVPLPLGAPDVRLRAVAYDQAELGSNHTEVLLRHAGVRPAAGRLYVLCIGISHYKHGGSQAGGVVTKGRFANLRFPAQDAEAMARRWRQEGRPLYAGVEVHTLTDEQATLPNVRAQLQWLQHKVRPGQVDTVAIFLSGHGISDEDGRRYQFPTYDFDPQDSAHTSLAGQELQEALGGRLRAKSVFLFVDTCHSGALVGGRNEDLSFEVADSGVYLLASSAATQYSFESGRWGHGAFTKALLWALSQKTLARQGVIHFNVLTYAVPDTVAALLREAGAQPGTEEPVVPLEGRSLLTPVAQPHGP